MERQSHTEIVRAPIDVCFDTIVDFQYYPDWFTAISTAAVLEHDDSVPSWTVEYTLSMVVKTISYTLAYRGKRPGALTWKLVRGDVKDVQGDYRFVELEPGVTEATCTQGVDVGFWIPGPLRRTFERTALSDSVREFKKAAEARAASRRRS
jgi:ribosome-associated toxin RatA of RatAB toxin-antitoxin module